MREVAASEAKSQLAKLLDAVEHGETIAITRRGRRIARIVPEDERQQQEIDQAIEDIRALQKETGRMTVAEIIASIHEGHKY